MASEVDIMGRASALLVRFFSRLEQPKIESRIVLAIMGIAAIVRIAAAILLPPHELYLEDSDSYLAAARDLAAGRLINSIIVMPGYPALLALFGASPTTRLWVDIALSVASVWCLVRLTQAVTDDRMAGLFAGLVWALYPFSIFYALIGYSETLFVTLMLLGFLLYYRGKFGLGSLAMVAAILTRPLIELLTPVLIVVFVLIVHRDTIWRALRHAAAFFAIYLVLMSPWWVHNFAKYGSFVRLNLAFGVVLYTGNNPMNRTGGVESGVDFDLAPFKSIADPVAWDRAIRNAAIKFIIEHPRRFIELAGMKFIRLWGPASGARFVAVSLLSFLPVAILAVIGFFYLLARRWRSLVPIVLFIGYTTIVHMITIGTLRYRFPMEPFLVLLAAQALTCGPRMMSRAKASGIPEVS